MSSLECRGQQQQRTEPDTASISPNDQHLPESILRLVDLPLLLLPFRIDVGYAGARCS